MDYAPKYLPSGGVLQAGIGTAKMRNPATLLLRGVITATYTVDDDNHPFASSPDATPTAIYCDVLIYSSVASMRFMFFPSVLVSQDIGGINRGRVWKPRATTMDISGNIVDGDIATNPADMDGDHVLVGFLDDNPNLPVILRGIPHPSADFDKRSDDPIGFRTKLILADGNPDFVKNAGSFYGINDDGDYVVDTSHANGGTIENDGSESPNPADGTQGNHLYTIEQHCKRLLTLVDVTNPESPQAVLTEALSMTGVLLNFLGLTPVWQLLNTSGNSLQVQDVGPNATMTLGDGSQHVAVAENLATWWNSTIKPKLDAFDLHIHSTGVGPSGPPTPIIGASAIAGDVTSSNLSIPTQS